MSKLTKAQRHLLSELPTHVVPEYHTGQKLIEMGLAEWADAKTTMMRPTEAGRIALADANKETSP